LLDLLNIRHGGGRNDGKDIAYPAQVLVDRDGTVRWTYESSNYRLRARPEEIFAALDELRR
jgi:peroxiredoxin